MENSNHTCDGDCQICRQAAIDQFKQQSSQSPCPSCGYCPTCGQARNKWNLPYYPYYPGPYITWTATTGTGDSTFQVS